jgi:hypothetical protein
VTTAVLNAKTKEARVFMPGSKGVLIVTADSSTLKIDVCAVSMVSGFCLRLARGMVPRILALSGVVALDRLSA